MTTTDSNGIIFLEETDPISPFHTLMNTMQQGTSDAITNLKSATPYVRYAVPADQTRGGSAWGQVNVSQLTNSQGTSFWTNNGSGLITVGTAGLYLIDTTITMTAANFAVRIFSFTNNRPLGQSGFSAGTSFAAHATANVMLAAGEQIIVQVYHGTSLNVRADSAGASIGQQVPSFVTIAKM